MVPVLLQDVDCMPLNPLENMPASLTRHNIFFNKFIENLNDIKMNGQPMERKVEGYIKLAPCENLENGTGFPHTSPSTHLISNLFQHAKVRSPWNVHLLYAYGIWLIC